MTRNRIRAAAVAVLTSLSLIAASAAQAAPAVGVIDLYADGFIRAKLQVELRSDNKLQAYMFHAGSEIYQVSWTTVGLCYLSYNGGPCAVGGASNAGYFGQWAGPVVPDGHVQRSIFNTNYKPWRAWGTIRYNGHDYQVTMSADEGSDPRADWYNRTQLN